MVNTGGGMAGGDYARFTFAVEPAASVTLTTTAAEKIYGSPTAIEATRGTRIDVGLTVGPEPASNGCRRRPSCSIARSSTVSSRPHSSPTAAC